MALRIDSYQKIESDAHALLSIHAITEAPIPIERLTRQMGVALISYDMGEEISGLLVLQGSTGTIGYNSKHSKKRQRFTIAHELGHYVLHREKENFFVDKDFLVKYRSSKSYNSDEIRLEQQANAFAAAILMPKNFIMEYLLAEKYKDYSESAIIDEMASKFDVSVLAMTYRLGNIMQFSEQW
jgi:Zn-dependent peptidase ImmA (M78 family)